MQKLIEDLWFLPRDIVSDGYDFALNELAKSVPMMIHEYPTGLSCWSWTVPEKWTCDEAWLEDLSGRRIFSYADHPLHVVSYSLPFDGVVDREELFRHLHVHPTLPGAIPFVFKYYSRDWGLCCSQTLRDTLTEEKYRVVIRSRFSDGALKVGEIVAPGTSGETFVLCAHLCHPGMVNDDLSGVVVGLEVMRELLQRKNLRHTYRFLILSETIGSVVYLSQNESLIPTMNGGLFLEMLGLDAPHALQRSFTGTTALDQCFERSLLEQNPANWAGDFLKVIGNDERQFNAPGVRVPMLSLSRVLRPDHPEWPYRQYHSSDDNLDITSFERLEDSVQTTLNLIDAWEAETVPRNLFKGEVFMSGSPITQKYFSDPQAAYNVKRIMYYIDGRHSLRGIAEATGIAPAFVSQVVNDLHQLGYVE